MSNLRAFTQSPLEKKRYTISYARWLDEDEALFDYATLIQPSTLPELVSEDAFTSNAGKEISIFLSGGVSGTIYLVTLLATTTEGQVKEDNLQLAVY